MELAHTMGDVAPANTEFDQFSPYHDQFTTADADPTGQTPYRTYNVSNLKFVSDNHSVMDFTGTYNEVNTMMESLDYGWVDCIMGGSDTSCGTAANTVGTTAGVAAAATLFFGGTTDGTASGTNIESYFCAASTTTCNDKTSLDASSPYSLVLKQNGTVVQTFGVPVAFGFDVHNGPLDPKNLPTLPVNPNSNIGSFRVAVPYTLSYPGAAVEFWKNYATASAVLLYQRTDNGSLPTPTVTPIAPPSTSSNLIDYTNNPAALNSQPALSPDRNWVAWEAGASTPVVIRVGPVGNAAKAVQLTSDGIPVPSFNPAWSQDGHFLAFVEGDGGLHTVSVDTSSGTPVFGTPSINLTPNLAAQVRNPSWSQDGSQIVFESGGKIYVLTLAGGGLSQLTSTGQDFFPSWSHTVGDNRIAYSHKPSFCLGAGSLTEYSPIGGFANSSQLTNIAVGPDGALWFTELGANTIGRISTTGVINEYPLASGSHPYGITAGPDGNLWFT